MRTTKTTVRLILAAVMLLVSQILFAQQSVTGVVTDGYGDPLIGVAVQLKDARSGGTVTDTDGNFTLSGVPDGSVLVFTSLGYKTVELPADFKSKMQVSMKEDNLYLEETVVIGYSDIKRRDLTGSVGRVDTEELSKVSVANFDEALAGRVAGVQVSSSEGMPGSSMTITIRGNNSLTQDNTPLYVIDGFPSEDPEVVTTLSPSDIQSIDILKDASATAIYGSRGANGVIMITTKKGEAGKMKISYNMTAGIQVVSKQMEMMNAYEFVRLQEEIMTESEMVSSNGGYYQTYNGKKWTLEDYRNIEQINWQDYIFQPAWKQSHNVSASGGSNDVRYNVSFTHFDQDGIVINSNYRKTTGRANLVLKRNKLTANLTANFSNTVSTGASPSENNYSGMNNLFYSVLGYRPVTEPNVPLSSLLTNIKDDTVDDLRDYRFNPILSLENEYSKRWVTSFNVNSFVEYEFIKGLKLKVSGIYTGEDRRQESFNNSKTKSGYPGSTNGVNANLNVIHKETWLNENTLTYSRTFARNHHFSALAGMTLQSYLTKTNQTGYKQIPYESLGMAGIALGELSSSSSAISESTLMSFLGRVNYDYASKYYITASFRADGSSKFAKNNRWGYFPSMSVAWNISNENFFRPAKHIINDLKIRAGWGQTGNNRIGDYDRFSMLDMTYANSGNYSSSNGIIHSVYPIDGNASNVGVSPVNLGNEDLKWETTEQTNIGVDMSFFDSRINLVLDVYDKKTYDLLYYTELPLTSGYGGAMKNIGSVGNRGLEITLSTVNIKRRNFEWTTDFNIAFNKNEVLSLAEDVSALTSIATFDSNFNSIPNYISKVGYPMGMMYGYVYEGTYKLDEFDNNGGSYRLKSGIPYFAADGRDGIQPGYPKYADLNDDGVIDANDRTIIGRGAPIHTGGFTNTFRFYGFDLSIFLQWSYGNDILNANRLIFESSFAKRPNLNQFATYADRWTFDNPDSDIPCVNASAGSLVYSSRVIEDGSYLRIKDVVLGYTFPQKWMKKVKISRLRLYVSAQNLHTFTSYSGYDPEVSIRNTALTPGLDYSAYPRSINFNFGLNLSF